MSLSSVVAPFIHLSLQLWILDSSMHEIKERSAQQTEGDRPSPTPPQCCPAQALKASRWGAKEREVFDETGET